MNIYQLLLKLKDNDQYRDIEAMIEEGYTRGGICYHSDRIDETFWGWWKILKYKKGCV